MYNVTVPILAEDRSSTAARRQSPKGPANGTAAVRQRDGSTVLRIGEDGRSLSVADAGMELS